jgi:transposase-like protein
MSCLHDRCFRDEAAALAKLESVAWPRGPVCPHCGARDRIHPLRTRRARPGLRKCYHCRRQFTVRTGTIFSASHVGLHLWLQEALLVAAARRPISGNQLHDTLGVTTKTAWLMSRRIRAALAADSGATGGRTRGRGGLAGGPEVGDDAQDGKPHGGSATQYVRFLAIASRLGCSADEADSAAMIGRLLKAGKPAIGKKSSRA